MALVWQHRIACGDGRLDPPVRDEVGFGDMRVARGRVVSGKVVVEGPPLGAALSPGHPPRSP